MGKAARAYTNRGDKMRVGIKQKILSVLVGVLALTTLLDALLASYFTNRQNQEAAFGELRRDLLAWQSDLQSATVQLRQAALATTSDPAFLNQFAELTSIAISLNDAAGKRDTWETTRTLDYGKSVSLNRLHLALRTGGFSSIAVYIGGKLSHYISATEAGMTISRKNADPVWLTAPADAAGNFPFQSWPSWSQGKAPPVDAISAHDPKQPAVSFDFPTQDETVVEIAVPVQGVVEDMMTDATAVPKVRFVSELVIADPAADLTEGDTGRMPTTLAVVVFRKVIDRAFLQEVARKTGKWPVVLSPDGRHRQWLADFALPDIEPPAQAENLSPGRSPDVIEKIATTEAGSFYEAALPWQFENRPSLTLALISSRERTLLNIKQTVWAILVASGTVLMISLGLGIFWIGRFINPIVTLTAAAKQISLKSRLGAGSRESSQTAIDELHPIDIRAPNEVGDLTAAFNFMIAELQQSFETLEQRVQARTAELRQRTRYLRTLIDTLPLTAAWLKDTEGRYLVASQSIMDARGMTAEEIAGMSDREVWPPELAEAYRADDLAVMASRRRKTSEAPRADGDDTRWVEIDRAPVLDEDGTVLGTVGFARDISERKAAEMAREAALAEAMRLARLRRDFLAQVSHELRTPLNAILGYAQILLHDKKLTDRQARGLATIQASGQHLLTLINDILDLSRIDADKLEIYPAEVNLPGFLAVVTAIIRVSTEEKSLLFVYEAASDLPATVQVDGKRLRQVLLNLIGNAVKFTDTGYVALRVQTIPVAAPGGKDAASVVRVRFEVEDSGIGMSAEQLTRIFSPFEQVAELRRRESGAGLGLAISQQLVRLMGGEIQVRSEVDVGSLFWFELDLAVAEPQPAALPAPRNAVGYEGPRRKVLIVDDVPQNCSMLLDVLAPLGFEVCIAVNGQEGLDQAASVSPDLIVMDLMMSVMDGLEATRRIRLLPSGRQVPILAITASATQEDEAKSYAAGATGFIAKPIDHDVLLDAIGRHLGLTWIYEEVLSEPESEIADFAMPPREELAILHRLALAGIMRDIRERADYLAGLDPRYARFARRLRGLADGYQSKAILALIERCLAAETGDRSRMNT